MKQVAPVGDLGSSRPGPDAHRIHTCRQTPAADGSSSVGSSIDAPPPGHIWLKGWEDHGPEEEDGLRSRRWVLAHSSPQAVRRAKWVTLNGRWGR
jgi:hypothetical protein